MAQRKTNGSQSNARAAKKTSGGNVTAANASAKTKAVSPSAGTTAKTKAASPSAGMPAKDGGVSKALAGVLPKAKLNVMKPAGMPVSSRRPPSNPDMPLEYINRISRQFDEIRTELESYAAHLRSLDRKRLNSVGLNRQGFIERSYIHAAASPEFLPRYLELERFREDSEYFTHVRTLMDKSSQIQEIILNINVQSADIAYTDALEFYGSVREAANRGVDTAETIRKDLETLFKHKKTAGGKMTQKKALAAAKALIKGEKDGALSVESISPRLTGGKRKIIDDVYNSSFQYKNTDREEE